MSNKLKNTIERLFPTIEVNFGFKKGLTLAKLLTKNFKGMDPMNIGVITRQDIVFFPTFLYFNFSPSFISPFHFNAYSIREKREYRGTEREIERETDVSMNKYNNV